MIDAQLMSIKLRLKKRVDVIVTNFVLFAARYESTFDLICRFFTSITVVS